MALLRDLEHNPRATRHAVRVRLARSWPKYTTGVAAGVFAHIVFVSDGLLKVTVVTEAVGRFFVMASRLPLELQMLLCQRAVGSTADIIPSQYCDDAFIYLAKTIS